MSEVSVFIVNYNSGSFLLSCVESLLQNGVNSVTVWDNASTDYDTDVLLEQVVDACSLVGVTCRVERSSINLGFGAGVNRAIELNGRDEGFYWIVNPDVIAEPGSVYALSTWMRAEGFDMGSPIIWTGDWSRERVWFAGGTVFTSRGATVHWTQLPDPGVRQPTECSFLTGAALMVTAECWRTLGGFDESLFLYWEDTDLSLRARGCAMKMGVVPSANVWHKVGASGADKGKSAVYYFYMSKNRIRVCGSYASRLDILFGRGGRFSLRLFAGALREPQGRWRKMFECVRGSASGLRAPTAGTK